MCQSVFLPGIVSLTSVERQWSEAITGAGEERQPGRCVTGRGYLPLVISDLLILEGRQWEVQYINTGRNIFHFI